MRFFLSNMAIKIIQAEELISERHLSFAVTIDDRVQIYNESDDPIESICIEFSFEDWEEISEFIKCEIAKSKSNG